MLIEIIRLNGEIKNKQVYDRVTHNAYTTLQHNTKPHGCVWLSGVLQGCVYFGQVVRPEMTRRDPLPQTVMRNGFHFKALSCKVDGHIILGQKWTGIMPDHFWSNNLTENTQPCSTPLSRTQPCGSVVCCRVVCRSVGLCRRSPVNCWGWLSEAISVVSHLVFLVVNMITKMTSFFSLALDKRSWCSLHTKKMRTLNRNNCVRPPSFV